MKNTTWKIPLIVLAAIVAIALVGIFMIHIPQNHANSMEEQIMESKAAINVQEKRRQDLVYNLADSVKSYNKHEAETLKNIVKERSSNTGKIESTGTAIAAIKESYPELKADKNYQRLMKEFRQLPRATVLSTGLMCRKIFLKRYQMTVKYTN